MNTLALINTAAEISAKLTLVKNHQAKFYMDEARKILEEMFDTKPHAIIIQPGSQINLETIGREANSLAWDLEQMNITPPLRRAIEFINTVETICTHRC